MKHYFFYLKVIFLIFISFPAFSQDDLDKYIKDLRRSAKEGGAATAFMSPGAEFLYGQDYFEAKNYSAAANSFKQVVGRQNDNAYAHYQLALSLFKQNDKYKAQQAQEFLQKAFEINPSLKERFVIEYPSARQQKSDVSSINSLEQYIEQLKYSKATGGKETEMNTAGNMALYGIEYFEQGRYQSANTEFRLSLAKDDNNPYINYLMAVGLAAMGKRDSEMFAGKAFAAQPALKARFSRDVAAATKKHLTYEDSKKIKTTAAEKEVYGGNFKFGTYTCNEVVYNGPNVSPAFRFVPKGSIEIFRNGTYRYLNNGALARYKYNSVNGSVTWLTGYFADAKAKLTQFQTKGQITINFSDNYRWQCACDCK